MADCGDDFICVVEFVDEPVGGCVGGEVEHGAVAADEEDCFVFAGVPEDVGELSCVFPHGFFGLEEAGGDLVVLEGFDG